MLHCIIIQHSECVIKFQQLSIDWWNKIIQIHWIAKIEICKSQQQKEAGQLFNFISEQTNLCIQIHHHDMCFLIRSCLYSIHILEVIWEKIGKKPISTDNGRYGCQHWPQKSKDRGVRKICLGGCLKLGSHWPKCCRVWYQMKGNWILNPVVMFIFSF